tara:strand:+ start:2851 stop:3489 length:639 start_codon:yes stop_codon:yes gene_type:complete
MPFLKSTFAGSVVFLLLLTFADLAAAQSVNVERIQEQQGVVAGLRSEIAANVGDTKKLIEDFRAGRVSGDGAAIENLFSGIEADTRAVLGSIALDSELRDALDDMRAEIDTLIARNVREPESARRDARLARLQDLKGVYQTQYNSIGELETRLIRRLADLNTEKRAVLLDAGVNEVERVVASLETLVNNLERLEGEIDAVANSVVQDPLVAQ